TCLIWLTHKSNTRTAALELHVPLRKGQIDTGLALAMRNELRPAVPVEKAQGQQVFEDVTRTRVDPALLEATQGNNYKLRVYPIPAHGTRRVVLQLAQTLLPASRSERGVYRFDLPLQFGGKV